MRQGVVAVAVLWQAFLGLAFLPAAGAQTYSTTTSSMLSDAQSELARNNYRQAEAIYRHLLRALPQNSVAVDGLALSLYLQGKDTQTIGFLRQSRSTTTDSKALALLASSYCRLGQYDQAATVLHQLKPWTEDDALLSQIAPCVLVAGDLLDGPEVYERLVADKTKPEDEYAVGLARAYIQVSRVALTRLRNLRDNQPYADAVESARTSLTTDAMSVFEAARQAVPSLRRDMSLDAMAALLLAQPESAPVLYGVGVITGERGIQAYSEAEDQFPKSVQLLLFRAEMLSSVDRLDAAVSAYEQILQDHPDTPGVHYLIGDLYRSKRKWDQALEEFQAQEKITPNDERVLEGIDACLQGAGRLEESYNYLRPFVAQTDAPEWALVNFGVAAMSTGHLQNGLVALQRAEVIDPGDTKIHYRLFGLYRETHQSVKAATELATFMRLRGAQPAAVSQK